MPVQVCACTHTPAQAWTGVDRSRNASVLAPHTPGPPQHRHARHDEGFYVLSGTVRFTVGTKDHDATAGTFVMVPAGAPHTFANPADEPAVMLSMFTPDLYVQYFRDLQGMITSGRRPTPQAHIQVMSRYATEPAAEFGRPEDDDHQS
ncbi:cupin domain-containing protein [Streptomyces sp. NA04227]|nr:cupin domain-containing protein [Streptomyces sp. NA04227]